MDLIELSPRDNVGIVEVDADAIEEFKGHFARLTYSAVLRATRQSFAAIKNRIGTRMGGGFLFLERPFFEVEVELQVPSVVLNPNLDEIHIAVNGVAKKVLKASLAIKRWGQTDLNGDEENVPGVDYDSIGTGTFYDEIASDMEVVKLVLLLTGAIDGTKANVNAFIDGYKEWDFLYLSSLQEAYEAFTNSKPSLERFEQEIKKYMDIETHFVKMSPAHNIGALSLDIQPLKLALKAEAAAWKTQFAKNLHEYGAGKLQDVYQYMKDTTMRLNRKVEDLDDVRVIMDMQQDIRVKESELDTLLGPIEEVYALLHRYEVKVPDEETDLVAELRYS